MNDAERKKFLEETLKTELTDEQFEEIKQKLAYTEEDLKQVFEENRREYAVEAK